MCRKSLFDPALVEEYFDEQFNEVVMPIEYQNAKVIVHCNDCEAKSKVAFHIMGGKCGSCRSYNTMRDKGEIFYEEEETETLQ